MCEIKKRIQEYEGELYGSWGQVSATLARDAYGLEFCRKIPTALLSMDESMLAWQCSFPPAVVDEVVRFPQGHVELLDMAYLLPERFVDLARQCPAIVALVSAFWLFCDEYEGERPDHETVSKFWGWFYVAPKKEVLKRLGFEGTRSEFRILSRVHVLDCDLASICEIRSLLGDRRKRRILSYLSDFNRNVQVLASWGFLDYHLLELAAREPYRGENLYSVVSDIREWLDRGLVGAWPYGGMIRSWKQALRIRSRLSAAFGEDPFEVSLGEKKFPGPPLAVDHLPDGLSIEAIEDIEELERETCEMGNCAVTFAPNVSSYLDVYFYRMGSPIRSTVQLVKQDDGNWLLNQIFGYGNSKVDPEIKRLVECWIENEQMGGCHAAE
ncbi:hypothetical protein VDG1235_832 [Verrucomicrobiia bacterium DG1235]|nr:hypothetical protein VDG1235_832 [Verrucomicrobiae bacterium DG1235]